MFAGRRFRSWIVGVLPGWVVENVADRLVATLLAGTVATLEYPLTANVAVCEPLVESGTVPDEPGAVGVEVTAPVGFTPGATLEPPPPPPPPQAASTMLRVDSRAKNPLKVRVRILAYYRLQNAAG